MKIFTKHFGLAVGP